MTSTQEILKKMDMAKLLTQMGFADVDPSKPSYLGLCILHNDSNTKSFSANLESKLFHCFGCKKKGNAIQLYAIWKNISTDLAKQELEDLPDIRSIEMLQNQLNSPKQPPAWRRIMLMTNYVKQLPLLVDTPLKQHFNERGLSDATLRRFALRAFKPIQHSTADVPDLGAIGILDNGRERFQSHQLIIPYFYGSLVSFIQARAVNAAPDQPKYLGIRGSITHAFNHDCLFSSPSQIVICEGAVDAMSMYELGHKSVIGIPGVDSFKLDWLPDFHGHRILLAFDNDGAGKGATIKIGDMLRSRGYEVSVFEEHKEFKDVNEYLQRRQKV